MPPINHITIIFQLPSFPNSKIGLNKSKSSLIFNTFLTFIHESAVILIRRSIPLHYITYNNIISAKKQQRKTAIRFYSILQFGFIPSFCIQHRVRLQYSLPRRDKHRTFFLYLPYSLEAFLCLHHRDALSIPP